MKLGKLAVALAATVAMGTAQAALFDRGGGMIYDSSTNLTWSQNADGGGRMSWYNAFNWADSLVYQAYDDWRLPTITPTVGCVSSISFGGEDCGYNVITQNSELATLLQVSLGNTPVLDGNGNFRPGLEGHGQFLQNKGPFLSESLQQQSYWFGTLNTANVNVTTAYYFSAEWGFQSLDYVGNNAALAWAVRTGDVTYTPPAIYAPVSQVPAPPAFILMLTGLGLLGLTKRFRKTVKEA